ncbi:sterol desaturase family protein [Halopseudomonas pachastrellae]|nr:sterol desaturase family protein [Halopseudomonas pachastrellae]
MNVSYLLALWALLWEHRLFTIPVNVFTVIAAFFVQELCYYWYHRTAHRVRWFWAQHVSHHTGEIMNMSTAARQSILNGIIGTWIFFVPAVLLGFFTRSDSRFTGSQPGLPMVCAHRVDREISPGH